MVARLGSCTALGLTHGPAAVGMGEHVVVVADQPARGPGGRPAGNVTDLGPGRRGRRGGALAGARINSDLVEDARRAVEDYRTSPAVV